MGGWANSWPHNCILVEVLVQDSWTQRHVGLVSRSRPHGFASLWKTKPNQQTQHNREGKPSETRLDHQKGALSEILTWNFAKLTDFGKEILSEAESQQGNPPCAQPSPAFTQFVKTWKPNHREAQRAVVNLSGAHSAGDPCPAMEKLPTPPPFQHKVPPPALSTCEGREAGRGNRICPQRFNSHISSSGTFLVSPWPCGDTSYSQDGKFPRVLESPWRRLSK